MTRTQQNQQQKKTNLIISSIYTIKMIDSIFAAFANAAHGSRHLSSDKLYSINLQHRFSIVYNIHAHRSLRTPRVSSPRYVRARCTSTAYAVDCVCHTMTYAICILFFHSSVRPSSVDRSMSHCRRCPRVCANIDAAKLASVPRE